MRTPPVEEVTWCGRASLLSILSDSHIGCAWSAVSECLVKPNQTLADAAFPPHSPLLTYFQALTPTDGSGAPFRIRMECSHLAWLPGPRCRPSAMAPRLTIRMRGHLGTGYWTFFPPTSKTLDQDIYNHLMSVPNITFLGLQVSFMTVDVHQLPLS